MATTAELGDFFGYAGMVMTFVYFLSPVPTCLKIQKQRDIQEFSVVPYAVGVVNCSLWVYWSVVTMEVTTQNLTPNLLINGVGAALFLVYVAIFVLYAKSRTRDVLQLLLLFAAFEVILISSFEGVVPLFGEGALKSHVSGLVTDVLNILLYGSPLVVMKKVIMTKSVKYMPLPMSVLTLVICILWCAQAALIDSLTVLVPNALGILLGVAQLVLYARYCRSVGSCEEDPNSTMLNAAA